HRHFLKNQVLAGTPLPPAGRQCHPRRKRELWDRLTDAQYLRVYVRQLRQKIEANSECPEYLLRNPMHAAAGAEIRSPTRVSTKCWGRPMSQSASATDKTALLQDLAARSAAALNVPAERVRRC